MTTAIITSNDLLIRGSYSLRRIPTFRPSVRIKRLSLPICSKHFLEPRLFHNARAELPDMAVSANAGVNGILESNSDGELSGKESIEEEARLARKRLRALTPYLVSSPTHGIIGTSKYADRLRKDIVAAARDTSRKAVLIFGEPGLQKSNLATLIHFGGPSRTTPMAYLDCARLDALGAELFGRGEKAGLVELVEEGTLLLKNVHKMPPALVPKLVRLCGERIYRRASLMGPPGEAANPAASSMDPPRDNLPPLRRANCRIIMTSNRQLPQVDDKVATVIKVPPLRLRPRDVKDLQRFYLTQTMRTREGASATSSPRLTVTPAAVRQLESYGWPGNITELQTVVERAVLQGLDGGVPPGGRLNEEVFWFAKQAKDRFRLNLLAVYPPLRRLLRSTWWPNDINFKFTAIVYPIIVALLLWGPQDRLHNPALAVFWDYWWPLVFMSFPLLGRVWCAVCPFMIFGELAQRWRTESSPGRGGAAKLLKWPRDAAERYGPPFLFSLFAAILVWEEVWDLPHTAALSGWLLLLITAGAVVCSLVFERRLWCRYLCPIGGMNGLMAKLSVTEVRARQGVCSGECNTYHCYKGGCSTLPDGLESPGCPLYSHPAQLTDNRNCVNCMECLKACPHGSVEFRLRLPGSDLWSGHSASTSEVALMFMLLGSVFLHHLDGLAAQLGIDPAAAGLTAVTPQHIGASIVVLAAPGLTAWGADTAARRNPGGGAAAVTFLSNLAAQVTNHGRTANAASKSNSGGPVAPTLPQPAQFLALSYGYLPLLWSATLSHYLHPLLAEGGRLLPISAAMFGWEDAPLPVAVADPAVISFLQGTLLLFGAATSAILSRKLAAAPWASFAPQLALITAFTAELWVLIL
ncbi:nitrogen assimilation regulatory protein [Volvox carteri f. nagariensis]|uniref:Nitrogen assimilation regulatory protein n=1 Tax=Volvox carteri f. nagariensis TaxID=3068 RepID=D8TPA9_VOLCA|nr:nitrogen assimilation regulatory protein [Volvox carteri f. nagariensis]EFJ50727.1 nitrogen assimilation regulatory protein [Volvox carteri f. nagariensis]|eukprot:XP_002948320.1 nitrogen assimilation regulatory protein [Volvox carteri f. nagariensis]